ncbi:uncharacterized protein N7503_002751 [Penicillium pulvis]|uniref:uncharacterized protein n=1 Tax=Penicillium pulvis TaxID=1562058 RepID=UPI0025491833|nr:uncharacterized protein N7503_002751 [Penicillium pulvis]KAJ5810533.1 hypothetical protein N7503_002751 [Penicillium pulvis]
MSARHQKRSRASDAADKPSQPIEERKRRRTSDVNNSQSQKKTKGPSPAQEAPVGDASSLAVEKHKSSAPWSFSRPVGGRYRNVNTVMTLDEAHLFIGLDTAVQVFATSTSRLVRTLQMEAGQNVIGYKICPVEQEILYIFTSNFVTKWHWDSGKRLAKWGTGSRAVAVDVPQVENQNQLAAYSIGIQKDGKRQILINALTDKKSPSIVALTTEEQINNIQVICGGRVIIACDGPHIFMGTTTTLDLENPETVQYNWREATLPSSATCFHLRQSLSAKSKGTESKSAKGSEAVDLVVGEATGSILVYQDVFNTLFGRNAEKKSSPQRLHWHRGSVNTVKWSRDGNYILSGGNESVIVLWQLDSGRKQFLPHLSSPILNITVSPQGTSYVVHLADNSVMVLSARELLPTATVTGLQLSSEGGNTKDSASKKPLNAVAALHPQHPEQLLVAVPASHQTTQKAQRSNAAMLQTFDIRSNSHISRQALARTNATTLNVGPEGSTIATPDIRNMDILHDGKWMATVDSWTPHPRDVEALAGAASRRDNVLSRPEIFLKFWKWSASSSMWELVSRIDGPHFNDNHHAEVLSLVARPQSHEFATLGADSVLRFWCPTARHRSGLKTDSEKQLDTWKCRNTVDLSGRLSDAGASLKQACMSFSEDGSVLAVCLPSESGANDGLVLLIDVNNCTVHYRRTGVFLGTPYSAKFLGRHLVVASAGSVAVWDTVDDIVKPAQLPEASNAANAASQPLVAVNPRTQTFAIASHELENSSTQKKRRQSRFQIRIYDISSLDIVFQETLGSCPLALLADVYSGDYIIVDAGSSVQRVGCLDKASQKTVQPIEVTSQLTSGLATIFSQGPERAPLAIEGDGSASQNKGLASVFGDTPSFSLPSLGVLFRNVVQTLGSS